MIKRRGYYITPECEKSLLTFKYSGVDLSPIYHYILSPFAEFLVSYLPLWVAPNAITTFGLLWMITSYSIIWYYCPNLDDAIHVDDDDEPSPIPRWIFLFNSIAMLCYQTLDNMDGKQARRTKSSSPLGLLFDHGIDSFNSILGSANWICAMGVSPKESFQVAVLVFAPMAAFYVSTWEEYYVGKLILPVINGPTEGLLGGALLSFTTWVCGVDYWHTTTWYDTIAPIVPQLVKDLLANFFGGPVRNIDMMVIASILALIREASEKIGNVVKSHGIKTIPSLFPIVALVTLSAIVGYTHPNIFPQNPRTCLHLFSLLFCEMVTHLMLNRTTSTWFNPVRWVLLPGLFLLLPLTEMQQHDYVLGYTIALAVFLGFKVRIVIHEICDLLKIWCFDIVTPYPDYDEMNGHDKNN